MKTAGVNLGALPLQCKTRSLIQALNTSPLIQMAVEHRNDPSTCCKVFCDVDDGGGDEEGGEGVVGVVGGPRVGKEKQLSHNGMNIDLLYFTI